MQGTGEPAIARVAAAQERILTRGQLQQAGFGRGAIDYRVGQGRLRIVYPGVYAVGHAPLSPLARHIAALLALGSGAVLSHRSAARIWELIPSPQNSAAGELEDVEATVVGRGARSRPGLSVHRVPQIDLRDVRIHNGVALTAPARTLIDVAAAVGIGRLERAVAEARVRKLITDRALEEAMQRAPGRTGVAALRHVLQATSANAMTRSEAERRFLRLTRSAQLPRPVVNACISGYEVDFLWPSVGLVVEIDGYAFHGARRAFERDRRRDRRLVASGYRVIRVTWSALIAEPLAVIAEVAQALAVPAAAGWQ